MRRGSFLLPLLLCCLSFALLAAQQPPPQPASDAKFVGSDACQQCHEDKYKEFMAGGHGRAEKDSAIVGQRMACEACHGPASIHLAAETEGSLNGKSLTHEEGIATLRVPSKLPAREANEICLTCHQSGEQFYWKNGPHNRNGLACITCHTVHKPADTAHKSMLKKANINELCLTCHKSKRFQLSRSSHMPIQEGGMTCVSCHNPHGSSAPKQLKAASVNELCEGCHADKRGPMLFDHAPVRENCLNCHEPHGSNNDKVLVAKKPFLCQRCHIGTRHPSTLYDAPDLASNRLFNRSCTNCHSQIHGSNNPSGRFFLR